MFNITDVCPNLLSEIQPLNTCEAPEGRWVTDTLDLTVEVAEAIRWEGFEGQERARWSAPGDGGDAWGQVKELRLPTCCHPQRKGIVHYGRTYLRHSLCVDSCSRCRFPSS
jgi:hypothetical protein